MSFNSQIYIVLFLPICVAVYFILNRFGRYQIAKLWLLGMSLWFAAYINIWYGIALVVSIAANYLIEILLLRKESQRLKRFGLVVGLVVNLGALGLFKYFNFFAASLNQIFGSSLPTLSLLVPLGMSFFTFSQIAFIVDSYKGKAERYSLLDYALFTAFFSKFVQGPIAKHSFIIPQFNDTSRKCLNFENISKGITIFVIGLLKKVYLADVFAKAVNLVWADPVSATMSETIVAVLSYTMQIYFDFSGYCDMAKGSALLLNIDLPQNFNSPYKSLTVADFWRRWHITLTAFFTEYIYIPLGGSRKGKLRIIINTMIVFLISGLWHGAAVTFIVWGLLHGVAVVLSRNIKKPQSKLLKLILWAVTFGFVNIAWVFFRAPSLNEAGIMLKNLFGFGAGGFSLAAPRAELLSSFITYELQFVMERLRLFVVPYNDLFAPLLIFALAFILLLFCKNSDETLVKFKPSPLLSVVLALTLVWCVISLTGVSTFIYAFF